MYRRLPGFMQLCIAAFQAACSYVPPPSRWHAAAAKFRRLPGGMQLKLCTFPLGGMQLLDHRRFWHYAVLRVCMTPPQVVASHLSHK